MLEPLRDLPTGVIGFRAVGKLEASDYRDVLRPAIEGALAAGRKLRVVLVFERFDGLSAGAAWQDLEMGVEHLTHWERIALVTDLDWMINVTSLFGWMTPGELKHFHLDELADAIAWADTGSRSRAPA